MQLIKPLIQQDMEDNLKTVAKFDDAMRASIAQTKLKDSGIESAIFGESSAYPALNAVEDNIELKVNAADYDLAVKILDASSSAE